jgi:hypothetical protein
MNPRKSREPINDDELGMIWWNALSERERAYWANLAGTGRAKDAWELFKQAPLIEDIEAA